MPSRRSAARAAVVGALLAAALTGCSGASCDELPGLTAERDAARADLLTRQRAPGADPEELGAADDAVHALDAQVYDLEQSCAG